MKKNINEFSDRATTVLVVSCITFSRLSLPKQGVCKRCCTVTRTDTVRQESQWTQPPEAGIIWDNAIIVSHWLALRLYGRTANRLSLPKQGFLAVSLTLCTIDVYWKYVYRKELQHLGGGRKKYIEAQRLPKREGCKEKNSISEIDSLKAECVASGDFDAASDARLSERARHSTNQFRESFAWRKDRLSISETACQADARIGRYQKGW